MQHRVSGMRFCAQEDLYGYVNLKVAAGYGYNYGVYRQRECDGYGVRANPLPVSKARHVNQTWSTFYLGKLYSICQFSSSTRQSSLPSIELALSVIELDLLPLYLLCLISLGWAWPDLLILIKLDDFMELGLSREEMRKNGKALQ